MEPVLLDAYALLGVEPSATDDEVHTMALTKLKTDLYGDPEGRRFHLLPQNDCHSTKLSAAYASTGSEIVAIIAVSKQFSVTAANRLHT